MCPAGFAGAAPSADTLLERDAPMATPGAMLVRNCRVGAFPAADDDDLLARPTRVGERLLALMALPLEIARWVACGMYGARNGVGTEVGG